MDVNTIKRYFGINVNGGDVHASQLAMSSIPIMVMIHSNKLAFH